MNHCVYCHKTYMINWEESCRIRHWGELKVVHNHELELSCCGQRLSTKDYPSLANKPKHYNYSKSDYESFIRQKPFCYSGIHHSTPIITLAEADLIDDSHRWRIKPCYMPGIGGLCCEKMECEKATLGIGMSKKHTGNEDE